VANGFAETAPRHFWTQYWKPDEMTDEKDKTVVVDYFTPWERRLEHHGWPTLLLIIVGIFIWRFSHWFQPKIDEAITAHFKFMDAVKTTQEKQAENGAEFVKQQTAITNILGRQEEITKEMAHQLKDVHEAVIKAK
jgi:hypothetical protein